MTNPFGNMQNFVNRFRQFTNNPMQFLAQNKLQIPNEYANDPNNAIQYLMNNGQLSQEQYTWAKNTAEQIQNNPMFMRMFNNQK